MLRCCAVQADARAAAFSEMQPCSRRAGCRVVLQAGFAQAEPHIGRRRAALLQSRPEHCVSAYGGMQQGGLAACQAALRDAVLWLRMQTRWVHALRVQVVRSVSICVKCCSAQLAVRQQHRDHLLNKNEMELNVVRKHSY